MSIVESSSGGLRENYVTLSREGPDCCKSLTENIY